MPNIKHTFVSAVPDGGDPNEVGPSEWNAEHTLDQYLDFPEQSAAPSAPTDAVRLYARNRAGRRVLDMMGPSGIDVSLQPALFGNNIVLWLPNTGTTVAIAFGSTWTTRVAGTAAAVSHPTTASTNVVTAMRAMACNTGTTATGSAGVQGGFAQFWRGNAAGLGGFFFFARFGIETWGASSRVLVGLSALNAALAGEPSAQNNTTGFGIDSGDTNWQVFTRDGATTNKSATALAPANGQVFDVYMFAPPNGSTVTFRVVRPDTGDVVVNNVVHSANLPVSTTFLYPHVQMMSTVGTTGKILRLNRIYIESDI